MFVGFEPIAGHHIIGWIVIGIIAGALAGRVVAGSGFGLFRDMVVGLVGAVLGGIVYHALTGNGHASPSFLVECLVAFAGAVVVVMLLRGVNRSGGRRSGRRGMRVSRW